jgi:predicted HAD superfamily Cof-like phosphohydrolase
MDSKELQDAYGDTPRKQYDLAVRMRGDKAFFHRSQYHKVREWHEAFSLPVADKPRLISEDRAELRRRLIQEEFDEFLEAIEAGDLENAMKELGDLSWVVQGTAVEMGIDLDLVISAIYKSNMSKLGPDGKPIYRDDGKVLKGPDYVETDLSHLL